MESNIYRENCSKILLKCVVSFCNFTSFLLAGIQKALLLIIIIIFGGLGFELRALHLQSRYFTV
jgi:hypothetical protein